MKVYSFLDQLCNIATRIYGSGNQWHSMNSAVSIMVRWFDRFLPLNYSYYLT